MRLIVVHDAIVTPGVDVGVEQGAKYTLTGPDGTRATFNDRTDPDFIGFLTAPPSGLDSPEVRVSGEDLVERNGGINGNFYFGRRPFGLEGTIDHTPGDLDYVENLVPLFTNLVKNPRQAVTIAGWQPHSTATWTAPQVVRANMPDSPLMFGIRVTGTKDATATTRIIGLEQHPDERGPVSPLSRYALRCEVYVAAAVAVPASNSVALSLVWLDDTGNNIGADSAFLPVGLNVVGERNYLTMENLIAPPGAVAAAITATVTTSSSGDLVDYYFTNFIFGEGGQLPADHLSYFDGGTQPNGPQLRTAWAGEEHDSVSTLYFVERELLSAAATMNKRIGKLQRASRALLKDAVLSWTPAAGVPVALAGRRAARLAVTQRLPKTFSLAMIAADPLIYAQELKTVTGIVGPGAQLVRNDGNAETPPVVTIRGEQAGAVQISNGGDTVRIDVVTIAGDVLVVDFAANTITVNGVNHYDDMDFGVTSWWEIKPGTQEVTVNCAGGTATWEITWRDAWE